MREECGAEGKDGVMSGMGGHCVFKSSVLVGKHRGRSVGGSTVSPWGNAWARAGDEGLDFLLHTVTYLRDCSRGGGHLRLLKLTL